MIKYIGSKRRLVPLITRVIGELPGVQRVLDLCSGTSRVGHALKARGYCVLANDHNTYAAVLARCYVQADVERQARPAAMLLAELNRLPGAPGWFTETYCERSRYFQPHNGARIEAIRQAIAARGLDPELEAVLLVALMEAADRVDSTTGVQMAWLKQWSPRSYRPLELRLPALLPRPPAGACLAFQTDALDAARNLEADLLYLDPPYNQHRYLGNYHVWETLIRWDHPEVYGKACKRLDCRTRHSPFNRPQQIHDTLRAILHATRARYVLVSFNDEGFVSRREMEALLSERGAVSVLERDSPRYVGAKIGIHNLKGEKVGTVGRLRNTEYLYLLDTEGAEARAGATCAGT